MSAADQAKGPSAGLDKAAKDIRAYITDTLQVKVYAGNEADLRKIIDEAAQPLAAALREAMEWNWIDGAVPERVQQQARDALRGWDQGGGQ